MAKLDTGSFPGTPQGKDLLSKVQTALRKLTLNKGRNSTFDTPPTLLMHVMERLKPDFSMIWRSMTIRYHRDERGASISPDRVATIGPFFLKPEWTYVDMQKIILHEYLHKAMSYQSAGSHSERAQLEHSNIDTLLAEMGFEDPLNPAAGHVK